MVTTLFLFTTFISDVSQIHLYYWWALNCWSILIKKVYKTKSLSSSAPGSRVWRHCTKGGEEPGGSPGSGACTSHVSGVWHCLERRIQYSKTLSHSSQQFFQVHLPAGLKLQIDNMHKWMAVKSKDNRIGHEILTLIFSFNYVKIR